MGDRIHEDWLAAYAKLVDNTEPPELFKVWAGIGCLAACLQRRCWIKMERIIHPNLYIILCGPSGIGKDTAMYDMVDMCRAAGIPTAADSVTREALIDDLESCASSFVLPDKPMPIVHNSLSVISPEFAVFLGFDNKEMVSALCAWFDCRNEWKYKTIGRGEKVIQSICVNIMGGTVPELVQKLMPSDIVGTGLSSRIIFVYGDKKGKLVALPIRTAAEYQLYDELIKDLQSILSLAGEFKLSEEFVEAYVPWYHKQHEKPAIEDVNFKGYLSRRALHVRKLAMIMSASRSNEMFVRREDFERAIKILEVTETEMPKVFRGYGRVSTAAVMPRVQAVIATRKVISRADLTRSFYQDLTAEELDGILATLHEIGYCKVLHKENATWVHYIDPVTGK